MDMDKYIGRLLDNRYEILEVIGVGGMAVVYKARCHRLNRLVAVKILKDDFTGDEEFRRRFHAESQAVAMLSHPNIVSVYDVSTSGDADYIVMELIDGISLKQYMEKKGVLNWKETLHFAMQICKAMEHAHSRGIVHRDIKPHNVMVLKNGSVKVADFGIARVMSKSNTLTKEALGSVHYISPEQAKGGRVDNRSDIYSLGVVMYEMMTGRPPYDGESPVAVAIQHINGNPPLPSTLNPNIPEGLEQIIMRAMARNPEERYPTAAALLEDMDEFRKNPSMLFDYQNPAPEIDAALKLTQSGAPRTTPAAAPKPAPQQPPHPPKQRPTTAEKRSRREEVVDDEEEHTGKFATVAMILCALVAVVAIIMFVVAMVNGGLSGKGEIIQVPNLLGVHQSEFGSVKDVSVSIGGRDYSDQYAEGEVMRQNPEAGDQIAKEGRVTVVISLGPMPEKTVMKDLANYSSAEAIQYLTETLGVDNTMIEMKNEYSEEVPSGHVVRTSPKNGEELGENVKVILWISVGPEKQEVSIPNVCLGNATLETAKKTLANNGFLNVTPVEISSDSPKGSVVRQEPVAGTMAELTTEIKLYISKGPSVNIEDPDLVDPKLKQKVITVGFDDPTTKDGILSVWQNNQLVYEIPLPAGSVSAELELTGKGKMSFVIKINNANAQTIDVNFDE